jgi:hypothetical protein
MQIEASLAAIHGFQRRLEADRSTAGVARHRNALDQLRFFFVEIALLIPVRTQCITHPQNRRFGYVRVSTYGQTLDAQLEQLRGAFAGREALE